MEFRNLKLLAEAQERLKPVLDEMGLQAKLTKPMMSEGIVFSNEDESVTHAVEIVLKNDGPLAPPLKSWEGCYMNRHDRAEVPLGDTGWSYISYGVPASSKRFNANIDETFACIEKCLRSYPLFRTGETHDLLTQDENFGKAYEAILERVGDITTSDLTCERIDGGMSMSFAEDYSGDKWEIVFKGVKAGLLINGEKIADAESTRAEDVQAMFNQAIRDSNIPNLSGGFMI
jgi:hypothetical protein